MMHLEILEKQSQAKPQSSRQQEIMTIKTKINKIETKITINSCFWQHKYDCQVINKSNQNK